MARADWQTPEQAQWQEEHDRRRAQQARALVDALQIWRFCPRKPCRRTKGCGAAEAGPCLRAYFDTMPEAQRLEFGLMVKARAAGATHEEAERQVRARIAAVEAEFGDGKTREGTGWLS